jgi:hypothetical protein
MVKWLKVWLIAVLAFHAAVTVVDGRRCVGQQRVGQQGASCATACGSCKPCGEPAPLRCGAAAKVCESLCDEQACCPAWACLLCRCDDRVPPSREQIPNQSKYPVPAKPAFVERAEWRATLSAVGPAVMPRAVLTPPARLAVLCIWRL